MEDCNHKLKISTFFRVEIKIIKYENLKWPKYFKEWEIKRRVDNKTSRKMAEQNGLTSLLLC